MADKDTELIKQEEQRYISANALEKFVSDVRRRLPKESRDFFTRDEMLLNFEQYVHMQPTIDAMPVARGEWVYAIEKGSCYDYHVTAKCSECGWDWFSKEGVGNYSAVFSAFITNGDSRPEEAKRFLLENARANNNLNYCPNCGAKMEDKT